MFASIKTITCTPKNVLCQLEKPSNSPMLNFVRWRKRRWAPKNASKIFYVREPTPIDPEEYRELMRRTAHYGTAMKAIRHLWKHETIAQKVESRAKKYVDEEKQHLAEVLEINANWNEETRLKRDAHQSKVSQDKQEAILSAMIELEEQQTVQKEAARKMVLREKEESRSFITMDSLEEEIEKALNARVNYNFAIDLEGNKYVELPDGSTELEKTKEEIEDRRASNS